MKNLLNKLRSISRIGQRLRQLESLAMSIHEQNQATSLTLGDIASRQRIQSLELRDHEFRISSQWGEDGILSYLTSALPEIPRRFIEFGTEDYREANTRWLCQKKHWAGLVIDGSLANVEKIRQSTLFWQEQLVAVQAFITAENINDLICGNGFSNDVGLLSIDIDGVDYWVWKAITCVKPHIVVIEYNSLFGDEDAVTVPYRPDFQRRKAHYSQSYYGASLRALELLGHAKGYALVGSNSAGNNAFFVKAELLGGDLIERSTRDVYVKRSYREARNVRGDLTYPTFEQERDLIAELPLVDVTATNDD